MGIKQKAGQNTYLWDSWANSIKVDLIYFALFGFSYIFKAVKSKKNRISYKYNDFVIVFIKMNNKINVQS